MATAACVTIASLDLTRALTMAYRTDLKPLQDWLDSQNIDKFTAKEITKLPDPDWEGPYRVCPPARMFGNMRLTIHVAHFIRHLWAQRHKDGRVGCYSGYRPEAYNDLLYEEEREEDPSAGMASQHIFFRALDLYPYNGKIEEFTALAEAVMDMMSRFWPTGFGKYDWGIHIDLNAPGKRTRRWNYRSDA